ncbi:MAG: transglycosylase SLT domain-containing protein [Alphaproteobacteria bacterium]|nr:transglycosylase SLT domain-containing protein [Alphaproteobacteria bacterium]
MRLAAVFLLLLASPLPALAQTQGAGICNKPIAEAEARLNLPKGLLFAIATVESSFRDPLTGIRAPWPYTVNAAGQGRYYANLEEAKKGVVAQLASDVDSVDVGCMQINLRSHVKAFSSLDLAFDPQTNVAYGAQFLQELYLRTRSWSEAIRRYHAPPGSPNGLIYLSKVMAYWRASLGLSASPLREAVDATPPPLDLAAQAFERQDYAQALARYKGVLVKEPDSRIAHLGLAMSAEKLGDVVTAGDHYRRALIYDPFNRTALDGLLGLLAPLPPTERLQKLNDLRQICPDVARIPALMSDVHINLGNLAMAARTLVEALAIEPEQTVWRLNLASIYDRLGARELAASQYERFLKDYRPGTAPVPVSLDDIRRRLAWLMNN